MTDGITTGLQHALYALAWAVGALLPLLAVASLVAAALPAIRWARHRHAVMRLRREFQRAGRASYARRVDVMARQGYSAEQIATDIRSRA